MEVAASIRLFTAQSLCIGYIIAPQAFLVNMTKLLKPPVESGFFLRIKYICAHIKDNLMNILFRKGKWPFDENE